MLWLKVLGQLSLGSFIIIGIILGGLYRVFKYDTGKGIVNEIKRMESQKNTIKGEINDLKGKLNGLQEMDRSINMMGSEINRFLRFIPNKMTSSMILNHLNVHAKAAGVSLENINNRGGNQKEDFYEKIKISVTVKGLFTQVLIFLSNLTGLTEIITVENFDLVEVQQRGQKIGRLKEVKMRMDIYGYRYIAPIVEQNRNKKVEVTQ